MCHPMAWLKRRLLRWRVSAVVKKFWDSIKRGRLFAAEERWIRIKFVFYCSELSGVVCDEFRSWESTKLSHPIPLSHTHPSPLHAHTLWLLVSMCERMGRKQFITKKIDRFRWKRSGSIGNNNSIFSSVFTQKQLYRLFPGKQKNHNCGVAESTLRNKVGSSFATKNENYLGAAKMTSFVFFGNQFVNLVTAKYLLVTFFTFLRRIVSVLDQRVG